MYVGGVISLKDDSNIVTSQVPNFREETGSLINLLRPNTTHFISLKLGNNFFVLQLDGLSPSFSD